MVALTILGRTFDAAPYKLGALIAAAPFIDAQRARQEAISERTGIHILASDPPDVRASKQAELAARTTYVELAGHMRDCISVLHVGISRVDQTVTVDQLLDAIDPTPEGLMWLTGAMNSLLESAGMQVGEAPAPAPVEDAPEALSDNSAT